MATTCDAQRGMTGTVNEPEGEYATPAGQPRDVHLTSQVVAVAQQIAARFKPERIVLFGSYAYGQPHPGSDVDVLVVMETALKEAEQAARICQQIDYHFGLDLIVRTPATLRRRLALGDSFLREIVEQGIVLYERSHA